jgi:hypothetical protein
MNRRSHKCLIIAALAALILFPATANAGVVGWYQPAQVQCDRMTNRIDITPQIAIGDSYTRQRVSYYLAIYSDINKRYLSTPNFNQWFAPIDHNAVQWTQVVNGFGVTSWQQTISRVVAAPTHSYYLADGTYYVQTRYIWEAPFNTGMWYGADGLRLTASSPWTLTQSYTNYGDWIPSTICKI